VGDGERLVQIDVTHVGAVVARPTQANLGVHVGAVEIHLAAMLMHDLAYLPDPRLEDSMRGRVGEHQGGQRLGMSPGLFGEVLDVHIACASQATVTTRRPAMTALAGLVPCADTGIKHTSRGDLRDA